MQGFFFSLIIGLFVLALLLLVFFTAGKKNKKTREADRQLIQNCCDEGLIRLYEQAKSESDRNDILEFVKEKLAWAEKNNVPAGQHADPLLPDLHTGRRVIEGVLAAQTEDTAGQPQVASHMADTDAGSDFMRLPDEIDWQAVEDDRQKKHEEYESVLAQNLQMQEVLSKIKNIEESLLSEKPYDAEK